MRYRALTPAGDYQFGQAGAFLVNTPEAVAQAVLTRLSLWAGEWFLDSEEGTPYLQQILGKEAQSTRDLAIKSRILETAGVRGILKYDSSVSPDRRMVVSAEVETIYGRAALTTTLG